MREDRQERFAAYVEALAEVIGHADRVEPLRDYCLGLLLPGDRKSVEPIAAVTAPARVSAKHQSLLHFVANAPWSNELVLRARLRSQGAGSRLRFGWARRCSMSRITASLTMVSETSGSSS